MKNELSLDGLRQLLAYSSETGEFTRLIAAKGRYGSAGRVCGSRHKDGYIYITLDGERYAAHRLAWFYVNGNWPEDQIDHINRVRSDNRIANLRPANNVINAQNRANPLSRNTSGFLGVIRARKKFRAMIGLNGVRYELGIFATAEEASAAYIAAKRQMHVGCTI